MTKMMCALDPLVNRHTVERAYRHFLKTRDDFGVARVVCQRMRDDMPRLMLRKRAIEVSVDGSRDFGRDTVRPFFVLSLMSHTLMDTREFVSSPVPP